MTQMLDTDDGNTDLKAIEYVTVTVDGVCFGLPVLRVNDVFRPTALTRVPLAPPSIAGILNLRGRIVTMIDLDARLGRASRDVARTAVTVELHGEGYGLMVDAVSDVVALPQGDMQPVPANLDPTMAKLASGVFQREEGLLVVLDIERVLDIAQEDIAA